jgi:peroxiredoxin
VDGLFAIDKLTQKFPGKLDVVAINSTDDESNVAALYKAQKFGFRLAVDKTGQMIGKTAEEYHVTANSLVIIDRNGKIAYVGQDRNKATTLIHQLMVR